MKSKLLLILSIFLVIAPLLSAGNLSLFPNPGEQNVYVAYVFNISNSTNCNSENIILHHNVTLFTNPQGYTFTSIDVSNITNPIRLCMYKDGILTKNYSFPDAIFDVVNAQNINISNNLKVVGNLTLGQKITFALGEIIDNIKDSWIRINGNLNVTGNLTANLGKFTTLNVTGTSYLSDLIIDADNITVNNIISKDGNISFWNLTDKNMIITENGRIGIGTSSPVSKLSIGGNGNSSYLVSIDSTGLNKKGLYVKSDAGYIPAIYGFSSSLGIGTGVYGVGGDKGVHGYGNIGGYFQGGTYALITAAGNVGIGTSSPTEKLMVNGSLRVQNSSGTLALYVNESTGYVGIGTSTPTHKLNVVGSGNFTGNVVVGGNVNISGQLSITGASRVSVTKDDAQTIATGTDTIVEYDDEGYDNLGEYDNATNYRFTATEAGYYYVSAAWMSANEAWALSHTINLRLFKNGVVFRTLDRVRCVAVTSKYSVAGSTKIYLAAGDYIDVRVLHNRGANTDSSTSAFENYFEIHRLS